MKITKEEAARRSGMAYALKVAKEKGVKGLEAEIKSRGGSFAPCTIPKKEMDLFLGKVKENTVGTALAMSEYILRNKFGFGSVRMSRFKDYMNDLADSIVRDYLTVDDIVENLKEETGIDLSFEKNDKDVIIR